MLKPDDAIPGVIKLRIGQTYYEMGQFSNAVAPLKDAVRLFPNDPEPHYSLSLTYVATGKQDEVWNEYYLLLKLDKSLAGKLAREILNKFPKR